MAITAARRKKLVKYLANQFLDLLDNAEQQLYEEANELLCGEPEDFMDLLEELGQEAMTKVYKEKNDNGS